MKSLSIFVSSLLVLHGSLNANDWPTYRLDNARSGDTKESLKTPLKKLWTIQNQAPQQAWTGPAKWDAFAGNDGLQSMRNFDPCYYVTSANAKAYFSSSADNGIHCVDPQSGQSIWSYYADAAVRFPPTLHKELAIVGSDDGYVYALDAHTGKLQWKFLAAPVDRRIPSNGKLISLWPVRTSVLVQNGRAFFGASLVPWEKSYLFNIDVNQGKVDKLGYKQEFSNLTFQGALLANDDRIYVPQGRTVPLVFSTKDGKKLGQVAQAGGTFALLDDAGNFFAGPSNQRERGEQMRAFTTDNARVATFNNTNRLVVSGSTAYLHSNKELKAFDMKLNNALMAQIQPLENELAKLNKELKKKPNDDSMITRKTAIHESLTPLRKSLEKCWIWQKKSAVPLELITTPESIIAGYADKFCVLSRKDGSELWSAQVKGKVHGLAVSDGVLYVSTDRGAIHAYGTQ